jgi:hypothetical protein
MSQWLSRLYTLHPYPGLIERRQAIAAYVIATAGLVAVVVATVLASANFAAQPHMVTAVIAALISAVGSWRWPSPFSPGWGKAGRRAQRLP